MTTIGIDQCPTSDQAPNHQAVDLMTIMPEVDATGILVHTGNPRTYYFYRGITQKEISKEELLELFEAHPRIRVVRLRMV